MEKAKNIIIVILIAMNAVLTSLIVMEKRENVLTQEQMDAISSVLEKNNISMYTYFPAVYNPMRLLQLKPYVFSREEITSIFFEGSGRVSFSSGPDGMLYELGEASLSVDINTNTLYYENSEGIGGTAGSIEDVYKICEAFLEKFSITGIKFVRDHVSDSQWIVEYRTIYENYIIYSNIARFTVTENGITRIRCSFALPIGFFGDSRQIFSADEALFQLMFRLKSDYGDPENNEVIKILKMDIVYNVDERSPSDFVNATPYYRFYIRPGNNKLIQNEPYMVNAYNNTIRN